ncbi:MAG: bi-domain-containing oxidoreductase [Actinomycetota bacterium]|nr:bi-domain-containing oxidoreductase [Actinomycetota bacterium]
MKQVVQNYKTGELALLDVPVPMCRPGGVLVRTHYSLISTGTELMKVGEASMSMLAKARARPDQVAKVLQSAATAGPVATYRKVMNRLDSYTPLGYSLCGVVEQVGAGILDVAVGDLIACAGNEHALHSEFNWVPKNLYCKVPDGVTAKHAAFGTVGAIAMQGVRRGEPQLGEVALVIGLGLIGQLVVQLLVASGARVIGVDLAPERCRLAERLGARVCGSPGSDLVDNAVRELTGGHGVDQVYLAAGGASNEPVELAARLSRDRGRVVDIGKCSLDLPWNAYYEKELDVRFSRSYGPGRYDPGYELEGRDYPIGYVRWTERRNLECFLDLLASRRVDVEPLISHVADFSAAVDTYRRLKGGELCAVAVLFRYPTIADATAVAPEEPVKPKVAATPQAGTRNGAHPTPAVARSVHRAAGKAGALRVAFVGAGNYASSMLLPHLVERADVDLRDVVTTSALSASNAKRKFGFASASTDVRAMLDDPSVDAVFVVTRHSSHAELTCQALRAGKAVFVEKPLALTEAELGKVLSAIEETGNDRLHVGFNRRFAPLLREARQRCGRRIGSASVRYLINAGQLDQGSWYSRRDTEGSRFDGEGGHFIDTVSWWLDAFPTSIFAYATPGQADLQILIRYADGSTSTITYATTGSNQFPKETFEVVADGMVMRFDDFRRASVHGRTRWAAPRIPLGRDKGQRAQLDAFVGAVRSGDPMPIALESLVATTRATLAVQTSLATGAAVELLALGAATLELVQP